MAPGVWLGIRYDIKVDSFSAGVLLYFTLSGEVLFCGSSVHSVMRLTITNEVSFGRCMHLSERCKDFMASLLRKQPQHRPTASKALCSVWFECKANSEDYGHLASSSSTPYNANASHAEVDASAASSYGMKRRNVSEQQTLERPSIYKTTFTHLAEIDEIAEDPPSPLSP